MYIKIKHTKNKVTTSLKGEQDNFKDRSFFLTNTVDKVVKISLIIVFIELSISGKLHIGHRVN